jgi:hypothetical protein
MTKQDARSIYCAVQHGEMAVYHAEQARVPQTAFSLDYTCDRLIDEAAQAWHFALLIQDVDEALRFTQAPIADEEIPF